MSIKEKVSLYMKEKGWSIPTTSERSGVPATTIKSIIYGNSSTHRISTLEKLAKVFDCTIDDLIVEESKNKPLSNKSLDKELFQQCIDAVESFIENNKLKYDKEKVAKIIDGLFSLLHKKKNQNFSYEIDNATIEWIADNVKSYTAVSF
jgi:transcriptional regulator with XRE-family HTH domain